MGILWGGISAQQAREAREYGWFNAQYFATVRERADRESQERVGWLVDASKDPYRLYWLLYSGQFDLRVVHLTKDPRAYVYSIARRQKSYSIPDVVRWSIRWTVENLIQSMLVRWHLEERQVMHLRYEDVATDSSKILNEFAKWLCLEEKNIIKKGKIRNYKNHAVSGNEMRWKNTNIKIDERWKRELGESSKRIVWKLTGWIAMSYGYDSENE